ncbi:DUF2281 domain-containing protein [Leptolyngbya sp. NK1-12]|uniref:DUF2281 domain-containing protein n=2 Tax=Leptolyngbya sp. NK1-12 TaxID=2547451 RepID=A0AA97AIB9_9CYAN|nr:DUF2281 domain-containing protein [Leptolyngbya sp. NK1-12]
MTKEQILQELEQLPKPLLAKVLEFARTLQPVDQHAEADLESRIWQAYLASERERREVYQRLADS